MASRKNLFHERKREIELTVYRVNRPSAIFCRKSEKDIPIGTIDSSMGIAIYLATTTILLQRSHSTELEITTNTHLTKIRSREGLQTVNE